MPSRAKLPHQPALDGLRGVAVAGVIAFHLGYLQGGFLGVDLFFTLSGYLITRLLLLERESTGRIDLPAFWKRRAWRLLPAAFLVLSAGAVYAATVARPDELSGIRDSGLAALVYVANWQTIATGDGYWAIFTTPSPFDHLWSLAIEEQFYVIWPLVAIALLGRNIASRRLLYGTGALAVVSSIALMVDDPIRAYLSTVTRASSILIGAVIGITMHRQSRWIYRLTHARLRRLFVAISIGFVAWSWFTVDGSSDLAFFKGGFLLHALAVAFLIAALTSLPQGQLARLFSFAPFRQLGVVSYGAYLWHWPIIVVFNAERTGLSGLGLLALRLGLTTAVTIASYRLVESPARRRWAKQYRAHIVFPVLGLSIACALVLTTVVPERNVIIGATPRSPITFPERTDETAADTSTTVSAAITPTTTTPLVVTDPPALPLLRTPTIDNPLRVLLVGDSYLYDAQVGIAAALDAADVFDVAPEARLGFALVDDGSLDQLSDLVDQFEPELVVTMWARFDAAHLDEQGNSPDARDEYAGLLDDALGRLTSGGATVAVTGLAPSLSPGVDREPIDLSINELFTEAANRYPAAFYLDPDPIVAPAGTPERRITTPDGALLVRKVDVSHYCSDGAARFGLAIGQLAAVLTGTDAADPASWWTADWRQDPRFDDPPSACAG